VTNLSEEVLAWFASRNWPGKVRELRNTLERAVIMAAEGEIQLKDLPGAVRTVPPAPAVIPAQDTNDEVLRVPVGAKMADVEEAYLRLTLKHTRNNKKRAADILGLCLRTLHNKLRSYESDKSAASKAATVASEANREQLV
jgi:DNA-binding NtrC family response regulator